MDNKTQRVLTQKLSELENNERRKLYKRAATLKKHSRARDGRRPESLNDIVLKLLLQEEVPDGAMESDTFSGTVVWAGLKTCRVGDAECMLNGHRIAVGDNVKVASDSLKVHSVSPRKTLLSRPDPGNVHLELPIAANVDMVVVVLSVKSPPLHIRLVDRYLIAIERSGAQAAICVNKLDLLCQEERAEEFEKLMSYADMDIPIIGCSVNNGEGIEDVRQVVHGRLCAFVGHSGVGKSSLLNALAPNLREVTGDVSEGRGTGRHTTSWSSLHELDDGTRIIDTPGIRSLGLKELSAEELKWHFPEFNNLQCKFSDCTHTHEPDCGVKRAIGAQIKEIRYKTYLRLLNA